MADVLREEEVVVEEVPESLSEDDQFLAARFQTKFRRQSPSSSTEISPEPVSLRKNRKMGNPIGGTHN